jgi:hypothetical protein
MRLRRKVSETIPPKDEEDLYDTIMANKKGASMLGVRIGGRAHENRTGCRAPLGRFSAAFLT